jgi:hypothetical protein
VSTLRVIVIILSHPEELVIVSEYIPLEEYIEPEGAIYELQEFVVIDENEG